MRPDHNQPVVVEPRREVVEIVDPDGVNLVVVSEAVPTYTGASPIDTVGAQPGDVLMVGSDGILRPRHFAEVVPQYQRGDRIHYVQSLDELPPGLQVGEYVTVINGPDYGTVYRVEER